jgi:hypothetical protein
MTRGNIFRPDEADACLFPDTDQLYGICLHYVFHQCLSSPQFPQIDAETAAQAVNLPTLISYYD